ncbi:MAG: phosphatidylserine decarboxylase family protein [Planctomycetes bacterium]|nr:phosphatidylserine decarboxylase family protein [Planctomycetota bacterium]
MTIARWGFLSIFMSTLVCAWFVYLLPTGLLQIIGSCVAAFVWLFSIAFFRNPKPRIPQDRLLMVSPATGTVADIEEVDEPDFIGGKALRIGIFLSVFDVHVNRSPLTGTIEYAHYKPGKFLDARHPDATHHNEANTLGMVADPAVYGDLKILVRQISGLIARRIISVAGVGDRLERGELYGMIKFGSRTELWLPLDYYHQLKVSVGQKVKCGETVLMDLSPAVDDSEEENVESAT